MEDEAPDIHSNVKQAIPFFFVKNMEISLDFYVNQLSFNLSQKWEPAGKIQWCLLNLGHSSIMLQEIRGERIVENPGNGVSIYFICEDALAIYRQICSRGVSVSRPFVGNGMWVVELTDPDGYMIFFESSTNVPEETQYTD